MRKKIVFKDRLLIHSKEYENLNLFISLLRLSKILAEINPSYFFEEFIKRIFELNKYTKVHKQFERFSVHHFHKGSKFKDLDFLEEMRTREQQYFDSETKTIINKLIYYIISMFKYWAKFPGSFSVLASELIFQIFNNNQGRHVYFLILSLLLSESRKITFIDNIKDKFMKNLKPLLFD